MPLFLILFFLKSLSMYSKVGCLNYNAIEVYKGGKCKVLGIGLKILLPR